MNPKLKSYLVIFLYLIIGFGVIGLGRFFKKTGWPNPAFVILLLFIMVNVATTRFFNLQAAIKTFWTIKKISFLPVGIVAGGLIAVIPVLTGLLTGVTDLRELRLDTHFTISSLLVTLATVAWEELWFRGIFLNYCVRYLSEIKISITIGLLFMLVHLLNPDIDLLKTGPTLFFAGAVLTLSYFYFRTIWLPVGLHFGNNYFTMKSNMDGHWFFGNEGHFGAILLAFIFLLLVKLTLSSTKITTNEK